MSCNKDQKLENLNGIFSDTEFQELNSIIQDFDNILINESQTYSTKIAYWEFSQRVIENNSVPIINGIDSLGKTVLKYKVFNKIWWKYKDSELKGVKYNFADKSNYLMYLKLIGDNSDFIEDYAEKLESANDLVPSVVAGFSKNIKKN